jgi:hypothetical protein
MINRLLYYYFSSAKKEFNSSENKFYDFKLGCFILQQANLNTDQKGGTSQFLQGQNHSKVERGTLFFIAGTVFR